MSKAALQWYKGEGVTSAEMEEAFYCHALTCRFTMVSAEDYKTGLLVLKEALERLDRGRGPDNSARAARAHSERVAYRLLALYQTYLAAERVGRSDGVRAVVREHEIASTFDAIITDIQRVQHQWFESHAPYASPRFKVFTHRLKLQLYTNIAGAWIFRELVSNKIALNLVGASRASDLEELDAVIKEDAKIHGSQSAMATFNMKLLSFMEAPDELREETRKPLIDVLESRLRTKDSLPVDLLECEVIMERLKQGTFAARLSVSPNAPRNIGGIA
jgi:hypothetical protein